MKTCTEVLVITNPLPSHNRSASISLKKFISILPKVFKTVHLISSNYDDVKFDDCNRNIMVSNYTRYEGKNLFIKCMDVIFIQIKSCKVIKKSNAKAAFFWIGDKMILPFIYCKFKRIDTYNFVLYDIAYMRGLKGFKNKLSCFLMSYMAKYAKYVCVESIHVLDNWPEICQKKNIKVIYLYADEEIFDYMVPSQNRENVVGMLTRLANEKNVVATVKAFHEFNLENNGKWKLMIIGDGPLKEKLSKLIQDLDANVELCGWKEKKDVSSLLNKFKFLLMPTSTEGLPNALLEAMRCGTPALATRVGGIKDLVFDGETGWYLDGVTSDEILRGLRRIPDNKALNNISKNAVSIVREKYSYKCSCENAAEKLTKIV